MSQAPPPLELMVAHALHSAFVTKREVDLTDNTGPSRVVPEKTIFHVDKVILFKGEAPEDAFSVEFAIRFYPPGIYDPAEDHDHWIVPLRFFLLECEELNPN